jgi:hypothetical protein
LSIAPIVVLLSDSFAEYPGSSAPKIGCWPIAWIA